MQNNFSINNYRRTRVELWHKVWCTVIYKKVAE